MSRALRTRPRVLPTLLMTCTALAWFSSPLYANPEGGVVVGGVATISPGDKTMTVMQGSDRAAINWSSFNVGADETLRFIQPGASSIMLNRVTGSDPSAILGRIDANGKIILLNRNGILFGKDSRIDVGALVAATGDVDPNDFMAGGGFLNLSRPGSATARIVNQGQITASEAGLIGLVAPQAENSGIITARLGRIQIGAGDTATLDLYGDGLMNLAVTDSSLQQEINHTGSLQADGGTVQLTAAAGRNVVNSLIGVSGTVSARAVGTRKGRIIMYAPGKNAVARNISADKGIKTGASKVVADGRLDVSGYGTGEQGGSIAILGDQVMLAGGALFDASGDQGGGDIKIGGDYLGIGDTPASISTYVDQDSLILNNAVTSGNGGRTIIWSDGDTKFMGNVFARGGAQDGNGGFVETSGHNHLDALGFVDLSAPHGEKGTYLLDPANIAIYGNVTPRFNATDAAVNLLGSLRLWNDGSDAATITLTYSSDAMLTARMTGVAGATTISTTTNLNLSGPVVAGAKIRLGSVDGQTSLANDATNANTYTIQSVVYTVGVGTTITLTAPLTTNYNTGAGNNFIYRGLVSQWTDKSNNAYAVTGGAIVRMPLWVSNGQNGLGALRFDGADNMISPAGAYPINADYTVSVLVNQTGANTGNVLSGTGAGHAFYFNGGLRICMFSGSCFATSSTNLAYGTPGILNGTFVNSTRVGTIYQNSLNVGTGIGASSNTQNTFNLGSYGNANYFTGFIDEAILFNAALGTNARNLLEQYQSAKWGVALDPFAGTALSEAVEAMDATNGFSVFAAEYLERLSATANIVLQATNNITLDLQTDTLNLTTAGRNITLSAGNQINTLSAGNITTNGGNITFNATGGINFAHATNLTSNGGNITMSNNVTTSAALNFAAGTGNMTFTGKVNGTGSVTASGNAMTLSDVWGDITPLNAVSLTSASGFTLPSITASSVFANATGVGSDLRIGAASTITGSGAGNSVVLSAGRNFINNSGAAAISTPAGRWLVYSTRPADNIRNGLTPSAIAIYNATYATVAPGTVAAGNRLLFRDLATAAPALTFTADAQNKQYGAANPALTFTRTGSFVDADTALTAFSGTPSLSTTVNGTTAAGSYPGAIVTAVGSLSTFLGYQFTLVNGNFTITPIPLTITASNATKNYGVLHTFAGTEFTSSGLINGDTVSSVTLTSAGTPATATVAGSPYIITPSAAVGTGLGNYTISYSNGQLTVNPVPLTVLASNRLKTYGATVTFAGTEFSTSGLLNSDTVTSVTLASTGTAATATVAGSPYTITPSAAIGSGLANYTISYSNGQLTVNPAALTITANNRLKTYGASVVFAGTEFSTSGLLNTDAVSSVTLASAGSAATATVAGSPYSITPSAAVGSGLGNYTISYTNGQLTVNAAPLTITANNRLKTYGASVVFAGTEFSTSGLLNTDAVSSVTLASTGAAAAATVAGSPYIITPSAAVGTGLGNYTISYANGQVTVNPAALTITANNRLKTYGASVVFAGTEFSTSGLLNTDAVSSVTLASAGAAAIATVGGSPYNITPSAAVGSGLGNYTISYTNGQFTVNPAGLTITANNRLKTYGASVVFAGTEFSTTGLLNSDAVSSVTLASAGAAATATVGGSPYTITPSAAVGAGLGNYTISYSDGQLTVNPAPLTITANNRLKTYGASVVLAGTEFSLTGLLNTDAVTSVTLNSAGAGATAAVAGSPYAITLSVAVGSGLGNYAITYVDGQMTLNPAPLTITANDQTRLYGQADPPFTATYVGLVAGDGPGAISGLSLTTPATTLSVPGTYTIVAAGATSTNYTITLVNGLLTIGGSIPLPFGGAAGQAIPEVLDRMIMSINDPVPVADAGWTHAAVIELDQSLQNFLSCTQKRRNENELGTTCW